MATKKATNKAMESMGNTNTNTNNTNTMNNNEENNMNTTNTITANNSTIDMIDNAMAAVQFNNAKVTDKNISAKNSGDKTEVVFANVYEGYTIEQFVREYGEKAILENIFANMRIKLQARARNLRKQGKSDSEIVAAMANWKVGDKADTANTTRISREDYEEFLRFKAMQAKKEKEMENVG